MRVDASLAPKLVEVDEAVSAIQSGSRIFLGSGCAEPQLLVRGLCRQAERLHRVEVCSLLTLGTADYVSENFLGHFRHNAFFIGANVRDAVAAGRADYTPIFLSEIPDLIRRGERPVDVALIQVGTPDRHGYCSLGIHVDIQLAALETASLVIAEVNPNMPRTFGATKVPLRDLDYCVMNHAAVLELPHPSELTETSLEIGMHVARLVEDGSCLQLGIGSIPNAVAAQLDHKHHLGLHSEMISDGVMGLIENGNVDNSRKRVLRDRTVASFAMGSRRLYDLIDENPAFEFHPSDFVNDPRVISQNDRVVAINSALQVDLTGQVAADSIGYRFYSGIGGQVDFIRGAAMSPGGKPIIALPSTARNGQISRIVPLLDEGAGVVTSRGDVHYIVTEYGVAYLHGKSIRERARALAAIAHPDFRGELEAEIERRHYSIPLDAPAPIEPTSKWRQEVPSGDDTFVVRPLRPEDSERLRRFFYSHTMETIYHRYFTVKKNLSPSEALRMCSVDYRERMAFGVFAPGPDGEELAAVGRYELNPRTNLAETAIVVGENRRRRGLGQMLLQRLCDYAKEQRIGGITASIVASNQALVRLHQRLGHEVHWIQKDKRYEVVHRFGGPIESAPEPAATNGASIRDAESQDPERTSAA